MSNPIKPSKPQSVFYAEIALWLWILWTTLYGIYETWMQIPEIEEELGSQLQGMISVAPDQMLLFAIAGYGGIAVISAWFLWKIAQGKHWARSSFMWGFVVQVLWTLCPPYHPMLQYISNIPDIGLQAYAAYLLYGKEANRWFGNKFGSKYSDDE